MVIRRDPLHDNAAVHHIPGDSGSTQANAGAELPRVDLLGQRALLGLVYRALAHDAEAQQAQLTLRRIEHCASEYTVVAQKRSQLKGALEIATQHALAARREATRQDLDLQLYNERFPPPVKKRGLFAPRRSKEQLLYDDQRRELEQQLALARQDAERLEAKSAELVKQAAAAEQLYQHLAEERTELNARFRREVAAVFIVPRLQLLT